MRAAFSTAACPRCRQPALHDLRKPGAADVLLASLRKAALHDSPHARRAERLSRVIGWLGRHASTLVALAAVAVAIGGVSHLLVNRAVFLSTKIFFLFGAVAWALLTIVVAAARTVLEMWRDSLLQNQSIAIQLAPDPQIDPTLKRATVRGKVRATEPVTSPLSGLACAAFRLLGAGPSGPIDDAGGGAFEVVTDDGAGPVRVDARHASLALESFGKRVTLRPKGKLLDYLRARAAALTPGEVHVEEALLRNGDEVIVEGTCAETPEALGYRDTTTARLFKELDGSPLIIRRV
ncbi:MAG TPA: hypothetical protein VFF06_01750 [Polyangia bacterium]|nr:hypothetical protein [Polyangia bacterium]